MYKFALIQLRNDETNVITRYDLCSMCNAKSEEKKLKIEINSVTSLNRSSFEPTFVFRIDRCPVYTG
jgi:hypothetical protein